uniref:tRNA(Ile)-lysidine synthetase n=1 Tax=Galdieria phlegrea TaxID=1389228 RepID=UPI0023D81542|nr:tRNA(Ile)-lysidine synthetase [Galdieria phlegrea]UNJ16149.1 tRNA(Ile)-lysidine synthase [Galdieria sp.]WDA99609.1 tRNA(Ile)-lysidine synthetase [Galdieria sulphuraria]WDA99799.1 tRNA(Ile)-lysidine synthetase [Galdieria phlegrea]
MIQNVDINQIINKSYLHKKFYFTLKAIELLNIDNSFIVSISGGQDSLTLLKLVYDFAYIYNWKIILVHFNHNIRCDSKENANLINKLAHKFNLKYYLYNYDGIFTEAKGRLWRYKSLINLAINKKCSYILTAHTLNDKIESLFLNLFRGSSLQGISTVSSISYVNRIIKIVRPIINFTREDTYWFCRCFYLPIWLDLTNYKLNLKRNRIRNEMLPYISYYFNPSIYYNLSHIIEILSKENEYIQWLMYSIYKKIYNLDNDGLNIDLFDKYHISIKRRIIQYLFKEKFNIYLSFEENSKILYYLNKRNYTDFRIQDKEIFLFFAYEWVFIRNGVYDTTKNTIDNLINEHHICIFINSSRSSITKKIIKIFDSLSVDYKIVNLFKNDILCEAIKIYSNCPIIPQIYINGKFIGGYDIIAKLYSNGQLESILK